MKIVGTLRTLIIGKELEIRRTLYTSNLYSSAFVVDKEYEEKGHKEDKIPSRFILKMCIRDSIRTSVYDRVQQ